VNTTDTEFYRAFADRVRDQLAHVPATFQAAPDAPCQTYDWCVETGAHLDHMSRRVALTAENGQAEILTAYLYTDEESAVPELHYDQGHDDWQEGVTSDQLRAKTNRVLAHLLRLDALADQYDALREGHPVGEEAPAADPALIRRVTVEEATLTPGSAVLYKQYGDLLRVAYDPNTQPLSAVAALIGQQLGEHVERLVPKPRVTQDDLAAQETHTPPSAADPLADAAVDRAMKAVSASLAGLQTDPHDVAQRLHRAIDRAQSAHLLEIAPETYTTETAYGNERFGTVVDALPEVMASSGDRDTTARALRNLLDMVIEESR
jgi:hypothetical protein